MESYNGRQESFVLARRQTAGGMCVVDRHTDIYPTPQCPHWQTFQATTEEEWEWAARGGNRSRGYKYSGSNDCTKVAWHYHNSKSSLRTYNVGTKLPNELGLYDMSGNVREIVSNAYLSYKDTPRALVANSSDLVTIRGGHFWDNDRLCRVSYRTDMHQESVAQQYTGFRLAASSL